MMQIGEGEAFGDGTNEVEAVTATPRLRPWTSPAESSDQRGASERKGLSEAGHSLLGTSGRSPVRSTSPGSTHVARLLSTPRTTNSSSWSCTSIATPETHGRSRKSFSPSPDAFGDSELELSLELVNHVPPHIADRLMDRLRSAEAARQFVENQCEAGSTLSSNFSVPGLPWLLISMVFLAQATAFLHGAAPLMTPPAQQTLVNHLEAASPEVEVTGDLNFTCEAFLWEAEREAMELQRRHQQLQAAFSGALEAASNWVGFLQKATQRLSNESGQEHQLCVEAARPGLAALQALINGS